MGMHSKFFLILRFYVAASLGEETDREKDQVVQRDSIINVDGEFWRL